MTLSVEKKIEPIVGVMNVVSEFVNETIPKIAVAVGNLNQRIGYPGRADFNTLKEAIAAKIDTKALEPLKKYKAIIKKNKSSYPTHAYQQVMAIIEVEEKKWKIMQEDILALPLDKVTWYYRKLGRWHSRDIEVMNELKASLEAEMNKISKAV